MPPAEVFTGDAEFYSTIFHELTHSTGHPSRLNRLNTEKLAAFGSRDYSQEELVAEMGAAFLCGHCQIENKTIDNSAAYIQGWLRKLRNDKRMVIFAAAQAQKAADFILNQGGHDHD
ncbi:zincin-like metallopeptidase domain-containing protein [Acidobacteria bacterium AH-259-O06]|nr:zincin-like metallopeptidase domain-containing protein [Acidobacteria bacterium AH-259-O06]